MAIFIFNHTHLKIVGAAFSVYSFLRHSQFFVLWPEWPHQLLTMVITIFLKQPLIAMNSYQHAKNQAFSSFHSSWFKILQSDWPRALWSISPEPDFPQIWDLCKNLAHFQENFWTEGEKDGRTERWKNGLTEPNS